MVVIHDLVEVDAGDTYVYDDAGRADKGAREQAAADRLYGLLPAEQGAELRALWDEFEHGHEPRGPLRPVGRPVRRLPAQPRQRRPGLARARRDRRSGAGTSTSAIDAGSPGAVEPRCSAVWPTRWIVAGSTGGPTRATTGASEAESDGAARPVRPERR